MSNPVAYPCAMARNPDQPGRIAQIRQTYKITKESDPKIGWILLGMLVGIIALFVVVGLLLKLLPILLPIGIAAAVLATVIVFGKRAEASAYAQIEGQPGAAAAALKALRSGWFVTPAVSMTKNQDIVHRVVGRPGVILVSEGPTSRVTNLLANERRKTSRFVPDVPITEIQCGNDEGQIPLRRLNRKLTKLPRTLKPAQVTEVRRRLEALATQPVSVPKGPMPKSARAARGPRG